LKKYFFFLVICLSGCASVDFSSTKFQPLPSDNQASYYEYVAFADAVWPENSSEAEKARMDRLNQWLFDNHISSKNIIIVSRKPIKKADGLFGTLYDIYYVIKVPK
jgi:hypothetical protein